MEKEKVVCLCATVQRTSSPVSESPKLMRRGLAGTRRCQTVMCLPTKAIEHAGLLSILNSAARNHVRFLPCSLSFLAV